MNSEKLPFDVTLPLPELKLMTFNEWAKGHELYLELTYVNKDDEIDPILLLDQAIELFESIPEAAWLTDALHDSEGRSCAVGHLLSHGYTEQHIRFLNNLLEGKTALPPFMNWSDIVEINNNPRHRYDYLGETPKQRVVAAFKLARKKFKREPVPITDTNA